MSRDAKQGYVFIPIEPLGTMLLSDAHDVTALTDQSRPQGAGVYIRNSSTGEEELYTRLEGDPVESTATIQVPLETAQTMLRLAKRFPDCPFPIQVRYYKCDFPAKNPHGWDTLYHVDHSISGDASFSNLTAQGSDVNDAVPTISIDMMHTGVEKIDRSQPALYHEEVSGNVHNLVYAGGPDCGDCDGKPETGCEQLYAMLDSGIYTSGDGGVSFSPVTTGITFTNGGYIVSSFGRMIAHNNTNIYYSNDPLGGSSGWMRATLPAGVIIISLGHMAVSEKYIYCIFNENGVIRSADNGVTWELATGDGHISAEEMQAISADGSVVFLAGDNQDGLISLSDGDPGSWEAVVLAGAATDDARGAHVAQWSERSKKAAVLFVAMDNGTDTRVYRSTDYGATWSPKLTLAGVTGFVYTITIRSALHGYIVYVHDGQDNTYKSVDGGNTFFSISNPAIAYGQPTHFDLCPHDPNTCIVIGTLELAGVTTLVLDTFSDANLAPLPSSMPAYPGPGTRTIEGGDRWRTNGLSLYLEDGTPAVARVHYGGMDHVAGRAMLVSMGPVGVDINVAWSYPPEETTTFSWSKNGPRYESFVIVGPPGYAAYDQYAIIRLEGGHCAWLHRSMATEGTSWKLHFISWSTNSTQLAPGFGSGASTLSNGSLDFIRVADFSQEELLSREGMAEYVSLVPGNGSFAHSSGIFGHVTVSALPSTTLEIRLAGVNVNTYISITINNAGSLTATQWVAGVDTTLSTTTIAAGNRLMWYIDAEDETFGVAIDTGVANVTFLSDPINSALCVGGDANVSLGGATLADLYVYPRVPTGSSLLEDAFTGATNPNESIPSGEYGLTVTGGAGGDIIYVENELELYNALSGIGPGLTPSTPRIVMYGPGAPQYIDLTEDLLISAVSNVTWDGSDSDTVVRGRDKKFLDSHNLLFVDLTLAGVEYEIYSGLVHAVQFVSCHDIHVENCTLVFANDETMSFTGCDDVYIHNCLIGDGLSTGQAYGLFFAGGDCNRIIVMECAIVNCTVRCPYTQGGAGNHFVRLYIHGTYVGPYVFADYGNIQINLIDLVFGKDLTDSGGADWFKKWTYPLVPYVTTVYWNDPITPYRLYANQYLGNIVDVSDALQDADHVPTPTGVIGDLVDYLNDNAGRRISTGPNVFDWHTLQFKTRMIADPDILSAPYWNE